VYYEGPVAREDGLREHISTSLSLTSLTSLIFTLRTIQVVLVEEREMKILSELAD